MKRQKEGRNTERLNEKDRHKETQIERMRKRAPVRLSLGAKIDSKLAEGYLLVESLILKSEASI